MGDSTMGSIEVIIKLVTGHANADNKTKPLTAEQNTPMRLIVNMLEILKIRLL